MDIDEIAVDGFWSVMTKLRSLEEVRIRVCAPTVRVVAKLAHLCQHIDRLMDRFQLLGWVCNNVGELLIVSSGSQVGTRLTLDFNNSRECEGFKRSVWFEHKVSYKI
jgi:hypothetical protein